MGVNSFSYIPFAVKRGKYPLGNFIPPLPEGVFPSWVSKNNLSDRVLVDPISANPFLAVELAASGFKVLSSRSNPNIWLMTEVAASAPKKKEISSVINSLLNTRLENETLFDHLQNLYQTTCANCGKMIQPEGYVWEKDRKLPISRVYKCQFCADEGEREITDFDIQNLTRLGNLGIHRSRAFHRIGSGSEYEEESLNAALDCYIPRALYVCMLLANRLERIALDKKQMQYLRAAMLLIFNDGQSLRHWPIREYRFLQLSLPAKFFEVNLFLSLQSVADEWDFSNRQVRVTYWPNIPQGEGGICFYHRMLSEGKKLIPKDTPTAITTIFPRPGQAFWTLSALWAGWLWGKKAVTPMRSALDRRKYDWLWFSKAVDIALKRITSSISENTPVFGILPQYTPSLTYGLFAGMNSSGFDLSGCAYRALDELLECQWKKRSDNEKPQISEINLQMLIEDFLNYMGEPVEYQRIVMHSIVGFTMGNGIEPIISNYGESDFSRLQNFIKQAAADRTFLESFPSELPGGSRWWLVDDKNAKNPITERIESSIRNILLSNDEINVHTIDQDICTAFSDADTPKFDLIETILKSYADPITKAPHIFKLRPGEENDQRKKEMRDITDLLKQIGKTLGQKVSGEDRVCWIDPATNKITYLFFLTTTAEISQFILGQELNGEIEYVIVFPGSRSALINHRISHDPRLAQEIEGSWHFLKFRYLRRLAKKGDLDMQLWKDLLDSDPPLWDPPTQLQII